MLFTAGHGELPRQHRRVQRSRTGQQETQGLNLLAQAHADAMGLTQTLGQGLLHRSRIRTGRQAQGQWESVSSKHGHSFGRSRWDGPDIGSANQDRAGVQGQ